MLLAARLKKVPSVWNVVTGIALVKLMTRPEPIDVMLEQSAVLVVDMQNAFASKGGLLDLAGFDVSVAAAGVVRTIGSILDARTRQVSAGRLSADGL